MILRVIGKSASLFCLFMLDFGGEKLKTGNLNSEMYWFHHQSENFAYSKKNERSWDMNVMRMLDLTRYSV